jgi:hypothetical protein
MDLNGFMEPYHVLLSIHTISETVVFEKCRWKWNIFSRPYEAMEVVVLYGILDAIVWSLAIAIFFFSFFFNSVALRPLLLRMENKEGTLIMRCFFLAFFFLNSCQFKSTQVIFVRTI